MDDAWVDWDFIECAKRKVEWVSTVYQGETKVIAGAFNYDEFERAVKACLL